MWYPLKNSVYALSAASIILAALLAFGKSAHGGLSDASRAVPSAHALVVAVDAAAEHLVLENAHQKALAALVLHIAAEAIVSELDANAHKASFDHAAYAKATSEQTTLDQTTRDQTTPEQITLEQDKLKQTKRVAPLGRRQSTMPFFSFGNLLPGAGEPSA